MRLLILSDLHLESTNYLVKSTDHDLVVLAGDTSNSPESLKKFLKTINQVPVIVILGNHEYYGHSIDIVQEYHKVLGRLPNVHFLDREGVSIGSLNILGGTLWTDLISPLERLTVRSSMNDFRAISGMDWQYWGDEFKKTREFLEEELNKLVNKTTLVVTHHAPSFLSIHPKYSGNALNRGFVSDLSDLILDYEPDIWVHGHTHHSFDYMIGKTRIICNPKGYFDENKDFVELILEV